MKDRNGNGHSGTDQGESNIGFVVHYSLDFMQRYVSNKLSEADRECAERHITACDDCMQRFITAVELEDGLADLNTADWDRVEEKVISELHEMFPGFEEQVPNSNPTIHSKTSQQSKQPPNQSTDTHSKASRKRSWIQHPITHYVIAASITLLLLASGLFSSFSETLMQIDYEAQKDTYPGSWSAVETVPTESWSHKMMERTGSWLNGLQDARFK